MSLNGRVERFSFSNRVGDIFPESIAELILRILFKRERSGKKLIVGYTPTQVLLKEWPDSPVMKADIPRLWIRTEQRGHSAPWEKFSQKIRECYVGMFLARLDNGEVFFGKAYWFNLEEVWFRTFTGDMRTWKWDDVRLAPAEAVDVDVLYEPREKILEEKIAELELEKRERKTELVETVCENKHLQKKNASLEAAGLISPGRSRF